MPVGFTSARWGSLASFGARSYNGSKKIYGTSGNSFVAAVEFGKDGVRAKAVTAGGLSSDTSVEALQRPGRALRHRQPARGLLLPEAARRAHREDLQAGAVAVARRRPRRSTADLQEQFGNIDIYLFDQLLRGRIGPGMRVLDAGCGGGRNLVYLLRERLRRLCVPTAIPRR